MATHKDKEGMVRVNFLVEAEIVRIIDALRKKHGFTRSEYARELLIKAAKDGLEMWKETRFSKPLEPLSSKAPAKPDPANTAVKADKSGVDPLVHEAVGNTLDAALPVKMKRGSSLK